MIVEQYSFFFYRNIPAIQSLPAEHWLQKWNKIPKLINGVSGLNNIIQSKNGGGEMIAWQELLFKEHVLLNHSFSFQ